MSNMDNMNNKTSTVSENSSGSSGSLSSLNSLESSSVQTSSASLAPLIEVRELCKSYLSGSERIQILKDVNLEIPKATTIALLGQSGSGKSTFLNLLGGLDRADSGSIDCAGKRLSNYSEAELTGYRQKFVGFIFQHHYMLKDLNALENVVLPARIAGRPPIKSEKMAMELLNIVGLAERYRHLPHMLSGGERQRVAVVRALINRPQFILADEPTGSLDHENAQTVAQLLFSLCRDLDTTMILVTHDAQLSSLADQQYLLENMNFQLLNQPAAQGGREPHPEYGTATPDKIVNTGQRAARL